MTFGKAKEIARMWVETEASKIPGFQGAFFGGSINWKDDNEILPKTSDIDIFVMVDADDMSFEQRDQMAACMHHQQQN